MTTLKYEKDAILENSLSNRRRNSGISQHHETSKTTHPFNPVKIRSYTPRGIVGHFVPSVNDSPIAPVSHLAGQYGGRSHANKSLHTAIVDKNPGKYDSVRVVKNVRSYKEFLDVLSQREIEEATEEGPIPHVEPIPRPR
uniref:Uncharacterized protein n=1 Tax=Panagrolaimus davidi TaxID=227884 RepID=A0A914Q616_9BILA